MTPRRLVLILAVCAATGLAGCDSQDDDYPTARPAALPAGSVPVARALLACQHVEAVQKQVKANADRELVFRYLDAAVREVTLAAQSDPVWISLQSGTESLRRGLTQDDQAASELGIAIARDQCRRAGVYLPGAVRPDAVPEPSGGSPTASTPVPSASAS